MNDQQLLELVERADPLSEDSHEAPEALFERVLASARAEREARPSTARRRRPRRRPVSRRAVVVAVVVAALVAAAVAALLPAGDSGAPNPATAAVLFRVARVAAKQPATPPPAPGQFVYTKSEGLSGSTTVPGGGEAYYNTLWRYTRQQWIGPDGSGRILQVAGRQYFPTSGDREAWIADGKPNLDDGSGDIHTRFGPQPGGYLDLSKVPADPGALKQMIEQRKLESGPSGDAETFTIIGDLLRDSWAPPAVRSALYTVAAQLPGVRLIGATHDQIGRAGTAVGYTSHGNTQELIFDPRTAALLAEQTVDDTGAVVGWTAYLASGVVDSTSATVSTAP